MGKSGSFRTGNAKTGEPTLLYVTLPPAELVLETPSREIDDASQTGTLKTGTIASGTATYLETLPIEATGVGTVGRDLPETALELETPPPDTIYVITPGPQELDLETSEPAEVTGSGTAGRDLPETTLVLEQSGKIGFVNWILDGQEFPNRTDEISTHRQLVLVFRVETETLLDAARELKVDGDKIDVLPLDDGGFTAIDKAGGTNTYDVYPPLERIPLRDPTAYHVTTYEESLITSEVDEWDVELELVRDRNRTDERPRNESAGGDEWSFETRFGTLATDRVSSDVVGTGADGVERFELQLTLSFAQALTFETALSRLEGTRVREISGASNLLVDETDDNANTLTIDPPGDGAAIGTGDYVATEFESDRINDAYQRVTVVVGKAAE